MHAKLHKLLALVALLGVVCTPVFAGKVICTTEAGHSAIEVAHDVTGCPETSETNHAPAEKSEPCEDRDLVGDLVSQAVKASCASSDTACLTLSLISAPVTAPDCALSLSLDVAARSPLAPPTDRGRLATVILLI